MTALSKQTIAQPYENEDATAKLTTLTMTALTTGSTHTFEVGTRGVILVVQNVHATSAGTITILSTYDDYGRQGDITAFSIAAGLIAVRKFLPKGWENASGSGLVNITVSADSIFEVGVIEL